MIGWLDVTAGASGDLLLGALVDAGVPLATLQAAVDEVVPGLVTLTTEAVTRHGLGATRVHVTTADDPSTRSWAEVRGLLRDDRSRAVFERLAHAEAAVHRISPDEVHFHEVGALDAIADVVGVCAGMAHLAAAGLDRLVASAVAVGSGSTRGAHGAIPVPAPAVLALLVGAPVHAGPVAHEACTPTGAALLITLVDEWGALPPMSPTRTGTGAGARDPDGVANVVRLVLGEPADPPTPAVGPSVIETNVDDLDPRLWPHVLDRLLAAGASDAWLTPILMKKGRPAHTLSVLVEPDRREAVLEVVFAETTTIGVREHPTAKTALLRREAVVDLDGQPVRVKVATWRGRDVNAMPEHDDVVAAAVAQDRPVIEVADQARALAQQLLSPGAGDRGL